MSDIVIKVQNLSKQYRIGTRKGYKTFREAIVDTAKAPFLGVHAAMRRVLSARSKYVNSLPPAPGSIPSSQGDDYIWALKDISFEVKQGEVVGIIGRNGAGKSTLLKILSEITEPTAGRVELKGKVGSLLEIGTGFHPELTGHENVYLYGAILGMDRWEVTKKFDEIVGFAGLEKFMDTPVKRYSSGMYMRLAFAVAAHLEPEILLIDEVLAVGDIGFQKKCLNKMEGVAKEGRTVLFVSHNMAAVNSLCEKAVLLNSGYIENIGRCRDVISYYKNSTFEIMGSEDLEPGLWCVKEDQRGNGATIEAVEMLDPGTGSRKHNLTTGDGVAFRLHYHSEIDLDDASFMFGICTEDNIVLIRCMTQRTDGVETPLRKGRSYIDCIFRRFPLAGGNYYMIVGIAHTMVKWLHISNEFAKLTILPFYDPMSQRALTSDLAYFHGEHSWHMPKD